MEPKPLQGGGDTHKTRTSNSIMSVMMNKNVDASRQRKNNILRLSVPTKK